MPTTALGQLDFDLAYLAMLTLRGIKPLSRWEARWDLATEAVLGDLGLVHRRIERKAQNGRRVDELVFSRSKQLIQAYAGQFEGRQLSRSPDAVREEGLFFGYPICCIERFLARGYARNGLPRRDQRLLFHWACPGCQVTPRLVHLYRTVYRDCRAARQTWRPDLRMGHYADALHQRATEVASWAAMFAAAGIVSLAAPPAALADLSHMLPTDGDLDEDGLKETEERFFNTQTNLPDTDGNGYPDGYDVARRLWEQMNILPRTPLTNAPYATEVIAKGTVRCDVCGEVVNMGFLQVLNPVEETDLAVPFLALHYMEHGGLVYRSDDLTFNARVDPRRTDIVINDHPAPKLTREQGAFTLHWHGLGDKTYQVHTTVDLNSPWIPGPTYLGSDEELEHRDDSPFVERKYYRLSW